MKCHSRAGALLAAMIAVACWGGLVQGAEQSVWHPSKTRVFIVSLARFKAERLRSFSTDDRLDNQFAELFQERGVPEGQIVFLKDQQATTPNIKSEFTSFLRKSRPGEMLFFYFGSHGDYDPETGKYSFCSFDDTLSFTWAFNAIERDFKGTQAILTTDCCYSGGIVDLAAKRETSIAYACLSSTYAHQTAWSGWRFMQCLNRGLNGESVVDLDGDGHVDLDELARYTARYMAFAAEGKPMFATTGGFDPHLRLASSTKRTTPHVGELVEVKSGTKWAKAEILDAQAQQFKVHFTKDTRVANDAWIARDHVRPLKFKRFPVGASVEVQDSSDDQWHSAQVLETWESLHLCRYDGYSSAHDEWFGPNRIRTSLTGSWTGKWMNDLDEHGKETLVLQEDESQTLRGLWSGNVHLKGERLGKDVFFFEGTTPTRRYRCAGRIEGSQLELEYCAHRERGHYHGWATLLRTGTVTDTVHEPRSDFSGIWTGTYENSRRGSGVETLDLTESADTLKGVWSGVVVTGERLGNATFYLEGKAGQRIYHVIGRVHQGQLDLNYSATAPPERYFGWSTLNR